MAIESNVRISKEIYPQTDNEKREMKKRPYKKLVVNLIYLANATPSDIAFAASTLSCFYANPGYWALAYCETRNKVFKDHFALCKNIHKK